jgi:hypothetical protein
MIQSDIREHDRRRSAPLSATARFRHDADEPTMRTEDVHALGQPALRESAAVITGKTCVESNIASC